MTPRPFSWKSAAIAAVILIQTLVLAMIFIQARLPAWTGEEIRLRTLPVDPRSLFRGNYARLNYEISQLPAGLVNKNGKPRPNQLVFVRLAPQPDGTWGLAGISFDHPGPGDNGNRMIRGRIKSPGHTATGQYRVEYGIEAYFAPKEKAMALEKNLRSKAVAVIWLNDAGRAALETVVPDAR